ncbi:spore photoproduct lyase family protein, partial [Microbacterium testaceum]
MPTATAKVTDLRTSPMSERIAAINDFVDAGFEVHVNFSPVILTPTWLADWRELFDEIDATLRPRAKAQLACEVIFLTHNEGLHQVNLGWHPRGEELLWTPRLQEEKTSQNGAVNVRYRHPLKAQSVAALTELIAEKLPYCRVRYAF